MTLTQLLSVIDATERIILFNCCENKRVYEGIKIHAPYIDSIVYAVYSCNGALRIDMA